MSFLRCTQCYNLTLSTCYLSIHILINAFVYSLKDFILLRAQSNMFFLVLQGYTGLRCCKVIICKFVHLSVKYNYFPIHTISYVFF